MKSVTLSDGLGIIPGYTFTECESLTGVEIPGSVKNIGEYAFAKCKKLETATLLNGVESIGECAFLESPIKSITIPSSVTSCGENPFRWGTFDDKYLYGVAGSYAQEIATKYDFIFVPI